MICNQGVPGSSPGGGTILFTRIKPLSAIIPIKISFRDFLRLRATCRKSRTLPCRQDIEPWCLGSANNGSGSAAVHGTPRSEHPMQRYKAHGSPSPSLVAGILSRRSPAASSRNRHRRGCRCHSCYRCHSCCRRKRDDCRSLVRSGTLKSSKSRALLRSLPLDI